MDTTQPILDENLLAGKKKKSTLYYFIISSAISLLIVSSLTFVVLSSDKSVAEEHVRNGTTIFYEVQPTISNFFHYKKTGFILLFVLLFLFCFYTAKDLRVTKRKVVEFITILGVMIFLIFNFLGKIIFIGPLISIIKALTPCGDFSGYCVGGFYIADFIGAPTPTSTATWTMTVLYLIILAWIIASFRSSRRV